MMTGARAYKASGSTRCNLSAVRSQATVFQLDAVIWAIWAALGVLLEPVDYVAGLVERLTVDEETRDLLFAADLDKGRGGLRIL